MIRLTRLNGASIDVNAELIKFIEEMPDTVLTLTTGDKLVVQEAADDVTSRVVAYRRALLSEASPSPLRGVEHGRQE